MLLADVIASLALQQMIFGLGSRQGVVVLLVVKATGTLIRQDLSVTSCVVQRSSGLLADHGLVATTVFYLALVDGR